MHLISILQGFVSLINLIYFYFTNVKERFSFCLEASLEHIYIGYGTSSTKLHNSAISSTHSICMFIKGGPSFILKKEAPLFKCFIVKNSNCSKINGS
ncbi:hypothetical protein FKM82_009879 [Ascaphus truei]